MAIFRDGTIHAAVDSAAVEVGETPRTRKPPEASLLVSEVGFLGRVEKGREGFARRPSSNVLELETSGMRWIRMRPKSGFAVSQIWAYSRRPRLADIFVITSWNL